MAGMAGAVVGVMYLDGELPAETFKERIEIIAKRYGGDIKLFGYNRDVLGPDEMPPLNTEVGRAWLLREIETVKPDVIFFDSIMCLLGGNMAEEESWEPVKDLVRADIVETHRPSSGCITPATTRLRGSERKPANGKWTPSSCSRRSKRAATSRPQPFSSNSQRRE